MSMILGVVAIAALVLTLGLTIFTIWTQRASATQFMELTKALLSWQVIAGGLTVGAGSAFYMEIKALLANVG